MFWNHFESTGTENTDRRAVENSEQQAREIAQSGDYYFIKEKLSEEGILEKEKERVRQECRETLDQIDFLTEEDLEMFTIIELYDKNLAMHSVETFLLAKDKAERRLAFGIRLIDVFAAENVTPEQFFRACFLHDVGKVYVPNFILNNETSIDEMSDIFDQKLRENDQDTIMNLVRKVGTPTHNKNPKEIRQLVKDHHLRPVHLVPIKHLLNPEELDIATNSYHLDPNLSLMDVIETHEEHSGNILQQAGYEVESDLAGAHHNYHGRGSTHQRTLEALQLSVDSVELLRIADITHALGDSRAYNKTGFSKPKIWRIILEETAAGKISEAMTYLWLDDEIKIFEKELENSTDLSEEDRENIEFVKNKLSEMYENLTFNEDELQFPMAA